MDNLIIEIKLHKKLVNKSRGEQLRISDNEFKRLLLLVRNSTLKILKRYETNSNNDKIYSNKDEINLNNNNSVIKNKINNTVRLKELKERLKNYR